MITYNVYNLDNEFVTSVAVHTKSNQAVCNALVEIGLNPLLYVWERA